MGSFLAGGVEQKYWERRDTQLKYLWMKTAAVATATSSSSSSSSWNCKIRLRGIRGAIHPSIRQRTNEYRAFTTNVGVTVLCLGFYWYHHANAESWGGGDLGWWYWMNGIQLGNNRGLLLKLRQGDSVNLITSAIRALKVGVCYFKGSAVWWWLVEDYFKNWKDVNYNQRNPNFILHNLTFCWMTSINSF